MVDSASCAVSDRTEGLWSALLLLNPLKQPYTKLKSSSIPRKGALFPATAPVKPWQSHHWDFFFSMSWHMPGSGYTTGPAFYTADMPVFWYLGHYEIHRPQNPPGTWICTDSVTWESLLREISPQLQLRRCFPWLLSSTVLLKALWAVPRLPYPPNKLLVFKKIFLAFTWQPLSVLYEPPLCISFPFICIQDRNKSLNFSGQFLTKHFFLPFFFLISLQGSSRYHIQKNTYFHSIPLVILSTTFFSCSEFPTVTFSTLYTSFTVELPLSFPELIWVLHWKQRQNFTQCSTSSLYNGQFRQYFLRTHK